MKAFFKTYWLELALFAVALVGELMVLPFLPEQVPVLWNLPARLAPKWSLLLLAVVQLPGACLVRFGLHAYFERYPVQALLFGCLERFCSPAPFSGASCLPAQFRFRGFWAVLSRVVRPFGGAGASGSPLCLPCCQTWGRKVRADLNTLQKGVIRMKAFFKTYWLEVLLAAVGFAGALIAMPFLPGSVPIQFQAMGSSPVPAPSDPAHHSGGAAGDNLCLPLVDRPVPGKASRPGPRHVRRGAAAACGFCRGSPHSGAVPAFDRLWRAGSRRDRDVD